MYYKNNEQVLYKYLPENRIDYFSTQLLRITQPAELNDSFECSPVMPTKDETIKALINAKNQSIWQNKMSNQSRVKKREFERKVKNKVEEEIIKIKTDHPKSRHKKFFEDSFNNLNRKVGIFSLSKNWDNLLMWSHYGSNQKGFCIGFKKFDETKGSPFDPFQLLSEVKYKKNRIKVPLTDTPINYDVVLQKSIDWKYEQEVRLITRLDLADKTIERKPFNICLFKFPPETIEEIILGAKISDELKNSTIDFCKTNKIKLFLASLDSIEYKMNRKIIEI